MSKKSCEAAESPKGAVLRMGAAERHQGRFNERSRLNVTRAVLTNGRRLKIPKHHIQKMLLQRLLLQQPIQLLQIPLRNPSLTRIKIKIHYLPKFLRISQAIIQINSGISRNRPNLLIRLDQLRPQGYRPITLLQKLTQKQIQIPNRIVSDALFKIQYVPIFVTFDNIVILIIQGVMEVCCQMEIL